MSVTEFPPPIAGAELVLPPLYDAVWSMAALIVVIPLVCAIVSISRHRDGLTSLALVGWLLLVVFLQVVGPLLWFLIGRPHTRDRLLVSTDASVRR